MRAEMTEPQDRRPSQNTPSDSLSRPLEGQNFQLQGLPAEEAPLRDHLRPSAPSGRKKKRVVLAGLVLFISLAALVVQFTPTWIDHFGYRTYYSQMEPNGDRYLLEAKVWNWIPGDAVRCVVIDADGGRQTYGVGSLSAGQEELQQKIAANTPSSP